MHRGNTNGAFNPLFFAYLRVHAALFYSCALFSRILNKIPKASNRIKRFIITGDTRIIDGDMRARS